MMLLSYFHELSHGIPQFLIEAKKHFSIVCLSNDVSEWSVKLRKKFQLETFFDDWIISGDVNIRKPSLGIYQLLLDKLKVEPEDVMFVDDRFKNIQASRQQGIKSVLFGVQTVENDAVFDFDELKQYCFSQWPNK